MISYDEKSKRIAIHTIADSPEDEYDRISDFAAVSIVVRWIFSFDTHVYMPSPQHMTHCCIENYLICEVSKDW